MIDHLSPRLIHAMAWDVGVKHARENGRNVWNEEDHAAYCAESERLYALLEERDK